MMPAPTPEPPVVIAPEAARACRPIGLLASIEMPPVTTRVDPSPMTASLVSCSTCTATAPATATSPMPPAAAIAQAWKSLRAFAGVMPVTATEPAVMSAPAPTEPRFVTVTTLSPTAAPIVLLPLSRL